MSTAIDGTSIRCTCCARRAKLGEIHNDGIEIVARHRGSDVKHHSLAEPREILEALSGTKGTGVIEWARGVIQSTSG